jgi:hypothetical protein
MTVQQFAVFDEQGLPIAFYSEDVHGARYIEGKPNSACSIPENAVLISFEQWGEFINNQGRRRWLGGSVVPFEPSTFAPTQADYAAAIEAHLNAVAAQKGYTDMARCVSYLGSTIPQWAAEAAAANAWRDAVWVTAYTLLAASPDPAPTPDEVVAMLPVIEWPEG